MPTYLYQFVETDGSLGEYVEIIHSPHQEPLQQHPLTKQPIVKKFTIPYLGTKHTTGKTQKLLSTDNLKKQGFSKYQKNPSSGTYDKIV
jgi:hypothetical protein